MAQSYKIPQNVDLEDKIFGPFTLKQFGYLLAAGIFTFLGFSTFYSIAPAVFYLSTFFIWVLAIAFVFIRPNEQPFAKYIFSFINFATKPQRRIWQRIPTLEQVKLHDDAAAPAPAPAEPSLDEVRSRLGRLAHIVDTRGWSNINPEDADVATRVTGGEAQPTVNVSMTQSEADELAADDVLAAEDNEAGPSRAGAGLDQMLRDGVPRPQLSRPDRVHQAARHAEQGA